MKVASVLKIYVQFAFYFPDKTDYYDRADEISEIDARLIRLQQFMKSNLQWFLYIKTNDPCFRISWIQFDISLESLLKCCNIAQESYCN